MNVVGQKVLEQDSDSSETSERIGAVISAEADVWSSPGMAELHRGGFDSERCSRSHSEVNEQRVPYVTRCLVEYDRRAVGTIDHACRYASEIRAFMPDGK